VPSATPIWPGNENFTYYGCVSEPSSGRLLPKQYLNTNDMTQDKCLQTCSMFKYAGVEYGKECWCGNGPLNWAGNVGAQAGGNVTESECSKDCIGNTPTTPKQKCGAGKRLNMFVLRNAA
jgi:WSC domain-containing protein